MALRDRPDDVRLVVVVDQFEELFTYRPQAGPARDRFDQDRDRFFANLLNAAAAPRGRVAVVLTMRSDFLSACAPFPQLSAVLSAHQELVGPLTATELREAIERPAYLLGCEVESGLTQRLLADVEGRSGALPLLQFALTEVWKKREVRRLTLEAYNELGKDDRNQPRGIEGVLDRRANEIYRNLTPADQKLCRQLFLRLVQPGEGTEDTRRRVSYRELLPGDPARAEAVGKLIQTLASRDARLITTEVADASDSAVEVAHEALIRGWTQLRQWVDAERTGLRIHRRLTDDSQEWANARPEGRHDFLYSGARLASPGSGPQPTTTSSTRPRSRSWAPARGPRPMNWSTSVAWAAGSWSRPSSPSCLPPPPAGLHCWRTTGAMTPTSPPRPRPRAKTRRSRPGTGRNPRPGLRNHAGWGRRPGLPWGAATLSRP
jgi:hypothetical protein